MIDGLGVVNDFVSEQVEAELIQKIDSRAWQVEAGQRSTQQYGWRYDFIARTLSPTVDVPHWVESLAMTVVRVAEFEALPNQIIINDYSPSDGIAAHVDHVPSFGSVIASLSLLSPCVMNFRYGSKRAEPTPILLERRALLILRGAARFEWYHEIPGTAVQYIDGLRVERGRRISITFRTVNRE